MHTSRTNCRAVGRAAAQRPAPSAQTGVDDDFDQIIIEEARELGKRTCDDRICIGIS